MLRNSLDAWSRRLANRTNNKNEPLRDASEINLHPRILGEHRAGAVFGDRESPQNCLISPMEQTVVSTLFRDGHHCRLGCYDAATPTCRPRFRSPRRFPRRRNRVRLRSFAYAGGRTPTFSIAAVRAEANSVQAALKRSCTVARNLRRLDHSLSRRKSASELRWRHLRKLREGVSTIL